MTPARRPDRMPARNHVIVTGGSRGLGEAIVRRLAGGRIPRLDVQPQQDSFVDEMMRPPRLW